MARSAQSKRPSMKDVAQLAGVSRTTASYVINDAPDASKVLPETKARVWAAVEELGYRPNAMAQRLRSNRSNVLGFITDDIATTPFAVDIVKGAQDAALAHNKLLLVMDTERNPTVEKMVFEMMTEWQVEGIAFATSHHRVINPVVDFHSIPSVLVDCRTEDRSLASIVPDEIQGGRVATETLLKKGHQRIGFINGSIDFPASVGRLAGYKQALAGQGVPFDESLVRYGDWWQESGHHHTRELMQLADPPTAIFCGNDWMAMGAYDALKELGLSIPNDVAVIGFDNREVIAAHMRPPLTTIALPYYEMGRWAVEYLIEQAAEEQAVEPVQTTLECPLVERSSV